MLKKWNLFNIELLKLLAPLEQFQKSRKLMKTLSRVFIGRTNAVSNWGSYE